MNRFFSYLLISVVIASCGGQSSSDMAKIPEGKNRLANATSPYLLQHAENPVDWYPWGEEALAKAKEEDKPILLSIGYSSCHWCHVMAHESFEDTAVAALMNANFVNIKLDREERPDIDQIYMDAVQAMGLNGGWPLNVFITPDQKPFYGGTYFPKEKWVELIGSINDAFVNNREKLNESAENFAKHIAVSETEKYGLEGNDAPVTIEDAKNNYETLAQKFDEQWGGIQKEPKFPMPAIWAWLMTYHHLSKDEEAKKHLLYTLDKIAEGGIYDQIGGGFSRYSVDSEWHVPHFEKMLYDNGQLLSLYANAYKISGKTEYARVIAQTIDWLEREMLDPSGGLYAALDADSEGEEGKFYVWTLNEVLKLAGDKANIVANFYDVMLEGNWEGTNVLRRKEAPEIILKRFNLTSDELEVIISEFNKEALEERSKRIRPGLDSKIISGWNGLALQGLCDSYLATGNEKAKNLAMQLGAFMKSEMIVDGKLLRTQKQSIQGFMEDYAAVIQSFITMYETFHDETYLNSAKSLTDQALSEFFDNEEKLFYFSSSESENLIARKKEVFDNVIPSSNAIMVNNLYRLAIIFDDKKLLTIHEEMLSKVKQLIKDEPEYMSYWNVTTTSKLSKQLEIVIIGPDHVAFAKEVQEKYHPNRVVLASETASDLPLMEYKTTREGETTIYVCSEKVCRRPVTSVAEAFSEIEILTGS